MFSTICLVLHGMSPGCRKKAIKKTLAISQRLILADFKSNFPTHIVGLGQKLLEIMEGKVSYRNFQDWQSQAGIDGLIKNMNLNKIEELEWSDGCGKTVLLSQS